MNGLYEQALVALHAVWSRRWLALGVAWGLCLLGWLAVALVPNSYQSSARVFVAMQSLLPEKMGMTAADTQKDIDRVRQTLTSAVTLEKVIRRTDLGLRVATDGDMADMIDKLRDNVVIKEQQDNLFQIVATSRISGLSDAKNAALSKAVVQNLIDLFVEENLAGDRREMTQTLRFLDEQLAQREKDLQAAEQKRVEFESKYMGLLPGEGSIGARVQAARDEMANIDQQFVAAQGSLSAMSGQLAGVPATTSIASAGGAPDGSVGGRIATLQSTIAADQARGWTDQHPDIVSARSEIDRLKAQGGGSSHGVAASSGQQANPMYLTLRSMAADRQAQVSSLATRKAQLASDLAQLTGKQAAAPEVAAQEAQLNRDYDVLKSQYDKLLQDREDVRLRSDVENKTDSVKFQVIDPPTVPRVPVAPNRPLLLTMVLIGSLAAGIAVAFAKWQLQTTYPTASRLEAATGLPVIGTVSEVATPASRVARQLQFKWFAGLGGGLAASYALLMAVEFVQRSGVA